LVGNLGAGGQPFDTADDDRAQLPVGKAVINGNITIAIPHR
jgi:hypothetical protein